MEPLSTYQKLAAEYVNEIQNPKSKIQNPYAPLAIHLPADLDTPLGIYLKLARGRHSFLLESVTGGEQVGRYSLIGADPPTVLTIPVEAADPLAALRAAVEARQV